MESYIAIKRPSSFGSQTIGENASPAIKRARFRDSISDRSNRSDALIDGQIRKVDPDDLESKLVRARINSFARLPEIGTYLLRIEPKKLELAQEILGPDYDIVPNFDLRLPKPERQEDVSLGHVGNPANWPEESGVRRAHEAGITGKDVIVAVLDTGCDAGHEEFKGSRIDFKCYPPNRPRSPRPVYAFDTEAHGTHVCGTIAGKTVGIAPEATLMVAAVINSERSRTSLLRITQALSWVASVALLPENEQKAVVLNMSLGFKPNQISRSDQAGLRNLLTNLVNTLGILPVCAIGNEGEDTFRYPGAFPEALSVGAVDRSLAPCTFSGGGAVDFDGITVVRPDIAGFGSEIYSSTERDIDGRSHYARSSGTSMAAAYVTGIAALVAQRYGLVGQDLRDHLIANALRLEAPANRVGAGLVIFK